MTRVCSSVLYLSMKACCYSLPQYANIKHAYVWALRQCMPTRHTAEVSTKSSSRQKHGSWYGDSSTPLPAPTCVTYWGSMGYKGGQSQYIWIPGFCSLVRLVAWCALMLLPSSSCVPPPAASQVYQARKSIDADTST
jgi:hypothetical protein